MKCDAKLCLNYFSVNVSILAVVFRWQISKNIWFAKVNSNSYHDSTSTFFDVFSEKDLHLNVVEPFHVTLRETKYMKWEKQRHLNMRNINPDQLKGKSMESLMSE